MSGTTARPHAFINRELSWLAFDERVLEEALDPATPLLERVKFVAIAAANLDEFFMVRVAGLTQAIADGKSAPDPAGLSPARQLAAVQERAHVLVERIYDLLCRDLLPALDEQGIRLLDWPRIDARRRALLSTVFATELLPVVTPLAIDALRPFPMLSSLSLHIALRLAPARGQTEARLAIVQVPSAHPRLLPLDGESGRTFVLLEEVIRAHIEQLFPGQPILEAAVIRVARDAELDIDDEGGRTQLEVVERELRRRRSSDVIRLEIDARASDDLLAVLEERLDIDRADVYRVDGPLDLRVLLPLTELDGCEHLRAPAFRPADPIAAAQQSDLFSLLDEQDVLLHHPYDSFDPVVALVAQAADDPHVVAIKQTLYRTSPGSPIIASLQRAAEQQKQVTVLLELTARFDEERNIRWARALEQAGAHVIYGIRGYKTHAKICLIVRRGPDGIRRYLHLGTGNYNDRTARLYTDFGLMTASAPFVEDATAFFTALTGYSDPPRLKKLIMAPTDLRARLLKMIAREARRAEAGQPAEIAGKMNALVDVDIVEALYAASAAGVRIRLNVRGVCTLRPGIPGLSDNIEVVSVVDRFLEHSRIYYFANGGHDEVYLSSADWMTRNLDRRIELMFPVEDAAHRTRVVQALRAMFRDTEKGRWLRSDGTYERRGAAAGEPRFRVQAQQQEEAARTAALVRGRSGIVFAPEQGPRRPSKNATAGGA